MSGFTDMMIGDGFTDPQEYMDYLEDSALEEMEDQDEENDYSECDDDNQDYSDEGFDVDET